MKRAHDRFIPLIAFVFWLVACTSVTSPEATPTLSPHTNTALPSSTPTQTPSPSATLLPTASPTATLSPTPTLDSSSLPFDPDVELPPAQIEIISPAPGARIVNYVSIYTRLETGPGGRVRVELIGEDGETLARKVLVWGLSNPYGKEEVYTTLAFEVEGVAEAARLLVSTNDAYGRLYALSSAEVILLAEGESEPSVNFDLDERLYVVAPAASTNVDAGVLTISGVARLSSERPIEIRAIARDGRVLDVVEAYVAFPDGFDYGVFTAELSIEPNTSQWIQIVLRETGSEIPGDLHYSTMEIFVER